MSYVEAVSDVRRCVLCGGYQRFLNKFIYPGGGLDFSSIHPPPAITYNEYIESVRFTRS